MEITARTKILELIRAWPFLLDFLAEYRPEFGKLRNPVLRNTLGRIATVETAAGMGHVPLETLLADLRRVVAEKAGGAIDPAAAAEAAAGDRRTETLKAIIRDLHAGRDIAELRGRFDALAAEAGASEIPALEQELVREGLRPEEIHKLCDLHVDVFRNALDRQPVPSAPPGHPVHTMMAENRELERLCLAAAEMAARLGPSPPAGALAPVREPLAELLGRLSQVDRHYVRKENQLFPRLEKLGLSAPPQVMWAVHDDVRRMLRTAREAVDRDDAAAASAAVPALVRTIQDMAFKEENILFPMTLELLDDADWREVRAGEEEIGYAFVTPGSEWPPAGSAAPAAKPAEPDARGIRHLPLDTGLLTLEQVNLLLGALPLEVTFVDENDEVRYFSRGEERIFPRSPGVIGRKVQNCHPPKSLHMVARILKAFREGTKNVAEFWIERGGRLVHIRYFALRDANGAYRGTLEVTQDLTPLRSLNGQRRLLEWEENKP